MKKNIKYAVVSALAFALVACGGGGGGGSGGTSTAPVAEVPAAGSINNTLPTSTYVGEQKEQFDWLNQARAQCGLGTLNQSAALDLAAKNHFNYLKGNFAASQDAQLFATGLHNESSSFTGYTGYAFHERMKYAKYSGQPGTELIGGPASLSSVTYHALQLMMAGHREIGFDYGQVPRPTIGQNSVETWGVYELGYPDVTQEPASNQVLTYPCNGTVLQQNYHGYESPDPFAGTTKDPLQASPVLMVRVKADQDLKITSWVVTQANTSTVLPNFKILTSANDSIISKNMAALILDTTLTSGASYTATITGTNNGQAFTTTYTFSVK